MGDELLHAPQESRLKVWPVLGIALIQVILCLAHWFLFATATAFWPLGAAARFDLGIALAVLSFSFTAASLAGFYFSGPLVRAAYIIAAVWMGFLNFFIWASCIAWLAAILLRLIALDNPQQVRAYIATALFSLAVIVSLYGFVNARRIRLSKVSISLPNLPAQWRGRTALLLTDLHLGHVNATGFARRIAGLARQLDPAIIFIAGDLYDGTKVDPVRLAAPLFELAPPHGIYFCGGNHEEFGDEAAYDAALRGGGIRVLNNELAEADGLQIAGVRYADTTFPQRLRTILGGLNLDPARAAILLNHVPNRLPLVEQAGFALQLSGHTHGGQIFPFTWFTHRAFERFTRGLNQFGTLQVFTSIGAGTWGPPMRVGASPEIILITFE